ncbi:MAG TPA: hypothetical protein VEI97_12935 [bacterium]|nr:hypothetical protein [bacterium]
MPRPFVEGRRYRVRRSFAALRDVFTEGEILVYARRAWSRYDGILGYFFMMPDREGLRAWDIAEDADIEVWREYFEEVGEG